MVGGVRCECNGGPKTGLVGLLVSISYLGMLALVQVQGESWPLRQGSGPGSWGWGKR